MEIKPDPLKEITANKVKLGNSVNSIDRRKFIGGMASTAIGFTIVPAHVLGGPKHVAPSEKINVAYIGVGTQGLRRLPGMLNNREVQVTAVCDPQKKAIDYCDWSPTSLRERVRETIGNPNWKTGGNNTIPGGLDNGKALVDGYYQRIGIGSSNGGCKAYADFRELFAKEEGVDAIEIMTPDHLHGVIAMAALKRGIAVSTHKPLSNRLLEGKKVIDFAQKTDVVTNLIPGGPKNSMEKVKQWIQHGVIGQLKEIHNWTNRPVWPHYAQIPVDKPKIPEGFNWDLWLGPEAYRPYHPHYTNMVFRGWYDFGGGAMADMGHYSLCSVFEALELEKPKLIEPNFSHVCGMRDNFSAFKIENDFSFPYASTVRFKYPVKKERTAIDLIWYDGGMKPTVPEEFYKKEETFPNEGMMFVGDKGIIMAGFRVENPYVLLGDRALAKKITSNASMNSLGFLEGVKKNQQVVGSFRQSWGITEAVNLYAVALRTRKTLKYDGEHFKITNDADANKYLYREYRKGWALDDI